jgi:hypothetical protein
MHGLVLFAIRKGHAPNELFTLALDTFCLKPQLTTHPPLVTRVTYSQDTKRNEMERKETERNEKKREVQL